MIHVIATVEVNPGKRDALLAEFRKLVPLVRAEAGCLEYGPAVDVATGIPAQGPPREDVVVVVEKWESLDALRAHLAAPHMQEYRGRVKDLVARVRLQVLQPAG
jgi:quinol monooxygenase YgiN